MKILIAGNGFIGEYLRKKLEKDHKIKSLSRKDADFNQDITEVFEIEEEFELLINTVGLAPGFYSKEEYTEIHVEGTKNLLNAVEADKVIHISALKAGKIDNSFFETKRQSEKIVQESGMNYTIIRPSTVYGEGNKLLEDIESLSFTRVFPDIRTKTQPITIDDLSEVVNACLDDHDGDVIRAGGPEKMTIGNLARIIYNQNGCKCVLIPYPQFLLEVKLIGLSFLPPPFQKENIEILRNDNTTKENDAAEIVDLNKIKRS
jgi:NADH dehydrogenase